MGMRDLLIIANYTQAPGEIGNNRFNYIAENLNKEHTKIEIVTSSFSHKMKTHRNITSEQKERISYKFTMLYEPGYKRNVSIKRIYSHFVFSRHLKKYLFNREKPDLIYCAVPSLDVAKVAADYARKNNIRFIVDIQDLWPEAFKMVLKMPVISKTLLYPMEKKAKWIYSVATDLIAVSQTYLDIAKKENRNILSSHCIYIGTDLTFFDNLANENIMDNKPENEIWLSYIGTLGHSYDIKMVLNSLKILQDKGFSNIKLIVMGDGPLKKEFEAYAIQLNVNAQFLGRLAYGKMVGILKQCDIAVNPICKGSAASIINKHADYAAAGLPVLNTQESPEYKQLVEEFKSGFNCETGNSKDLAEKILILYKDKELRKIMGKNSRSMAEVKFNRNTTYKQIYALLNERQLGSEYELTSFVISNES